MHYPLFYDRICGFRSRPVWSSIYVIVQRVFCGGNCHLISVTLPYIYVAPAVPTRLADIHHLQTIASTCLARCVSCLLLGNPSETSTGVHWRNIYSAYAIAIVRWHVHNRDMSLMRHRHLRNSRYDRCRDHGVHKEKKI